MERPTQVSWGRFDDLVAGTGLLFPTPFRVLDAREPGEVAALLDEVDRATRQGCWAYGYLAYEAAAGLDPRLAVADRPAGHELPLAWFGLCDEPTVVPPVAVPTRRRYTVDRWQRGWTRAGYRSDVARIRDHIAAGDTYQCNLTVRLHSTVRGDLPALYSDLAHNQRAHYAAYVDLGRYVVAGASPELFFEWSGDQLLTRPMKGTAARGRTAVEDEQRLRDLLSSDKERAENIIVVDLLRNDISRIARPGSVSVPALCVPERYETVWQLTSDVTGEVPADTPLVDVFRALFPSGSVTGAPKPRTMEIIRNLEGAPRGVYCGAVGWVAPLGTTCRARFNVAIRTVVVDRRTGHAVYGTGGGITWGSDADAEHAELLSKAALLPTPYDQPAVTEPVAGARPG